MVHVIPAEAGIQKRQESMDSGFHRNDRYKFVAAFLMYDDL
jgi:hypothetical protein